MNRWDVYEFLKHRCMTTGRLPQLEDVTRRFPKMDRLEVAEGIEEFLRVWASYPSRL